MTIPETFPCIICGAVLLRAEDSAEGQPNHGLMCLTYGNYGSTVFDPEDYSYLAFNICDQCMVDRAKLGRVMVTRSRAPIIMDGFGPIGYQWTDRPYVEWRKDLPGDGAEVVLDHHELEMFYEMYWERSGRPVLGRWGNNGVVLTVPLEAVMDG
jgi:hypothetical protein